MPQRAESFGRRCREVGIITENNLHHARIQHCHNLCAEIAFGKRRQLAGEKFIAVFPFAGNLSKRTVLLRKNPFAGDQSIPDLNRLLLTEGIDKLLLLHFITQRTHTTRRPES